MIVLHALWSRQPGLGLWGEDGSRTRRPPAGRHRQRPHPFACDLGRLRDAARLVGAGAAALESPPVTLLLPSAAGAPQASPQLVRENGTEPGTPDALAAFSVPTMTLAPAAAFDFLTALPAGTPDGVVAGASLRLFAEVATLALELVARGRVVPGFATDGGRTVARWQPVVRDEEDRRRLEHLVAAMPPVCRAGSPDEPPAVVIEEALAALADACVRAVLPPAAAVPRGKGRGARAAPAGEAWLAALAAGDPAVAVTPAGLAALETNAGAWARAGLGADGAAFRTCFRLSPPADGGAGPVRAPVRPFRLDILLQATDDRSLLVPAAEVWRARGAKATFLRRTLEHPHERLLEDLGRAARLYPGLEPALRTATPTGLDLDAEGAHGFLREAAPLLEPAGFGVLVPPWWSRPAARLGVKLAARPKRDGSATASGLLGTDAICRYEWQVALGGESLSLAELRALASLKAPLVQLRGQWVELRRDEIDAALAFFERQGAGGEMRIADALRVGMGIDPSPAGLPVVGLEGDGWLGGLLAAHDDAKLEPVETPARFVGTLRPYQARGLSWLAFLSRVGLGACLADDMGLGKTPQLLALLLTERAGRKRPDPTLLVCPMSVVGNWEREAARFAPSLRVHVHHGALRLGGPDFEEAVRGADLVITTYALAARDEALLAGVEWGRIALDEAQNVKNPAARQAQAIRRLRAPHRVALTGTPVENRLSDLWSIMEILNPGLLGPAADFRRRFATPIERYRDEDAAAQLKRLTGPFILRRLKTDRRIIADLPDKLEMKVFCNLTREQASLYQAVVDEMLRRIEGSEGIERKGLVLATMLKLKQVCNHPAHLLQDRSSLDGRSGKLARLEEILEEVLEVGDKALVFTQFAEMGEMLRPHLARRLGREVLWLHGGTSKTARDALVARFGEPGGPPVFLLSLKAGGTGLNLTAASHVVHFDRWWNPAVEDQATDRAFRIGQRRKVQVRKLVCAGTLEERIDALIESKKDLAGRIVGTGEAWLTELSTAELRDLLTLSAGAVAEG